jgi:hypothetical protein
MILVGEAAMAGRKVRDAHEARQLLESAERAGISLATCARRHGIDGRSLNAWRMNFQRSAAPSAPDLRLVELVARRDVDLAGHDAPIRIRHGDFVVEVPTDVDETLLLRVLSALAAC